MKKLLVVLLCLFITACGTKTKNSDISDSVLRKYKEDLSYIKKTKKFDNVSDKMNMKLYYTEINEGYRYELVIDEPKENMCNIKAISYSSSCLDDYQPTIGYFDKETYSMVPGVVDKKKNIYKGISLSGRVKKKETLKVFVHYDKKKSDSDESYSYCFEVKNEN
jgi:hypothetical protein